MHSVLKDMQFVDGLNMCCSSLFLHFKHSVCLYKVDKSAVIFTL